ncbi:hypothetical protein CYMTET_56747 [Cymbomonas tetramitiformis]|uniref:Uncharacterized protein n=1 Tax=Cymbomonas tetramitiformis TaxID=36881 RepID=A0AAE0ENG3_9CHLO|nr:hypothetical protein CYMTET_56747 [Cymbomonas tetramitiformis]
MVPKDYRRISVRGLTIADNDNNDHSIRVFAQVEGLEKQAIATQGDASTGFRSRQDACEGGCIAACERAAVGACAPNALEDCRTLCVDACTKPDPATGKFSTIILGSCGCMC